MKNFENIIVPDEEIEVYNNFYEEYSSYSIVELTDKLRVLEEQPDDNLIEIKAIRDVLREMDIDFNLYSQD